MYGHIPFDELTKHFGIETDALKQKTYAELERLTDVMKHERATDESKRNAGDAEYRRILKKYLRGYELLNRWWTEDEIVEAASRHATVRDIVSEVPLRKGCKHWDQNAEYLGDKWDTLPRYTKSGEQLMNGERTICSVYRVANQYQGLCHGDIVLDLLYGTYPQLARFQFSAYSIDHARDVESYEIYPRNGVYTPLKAIMERDIDAIIARNVDYAKTYNAGEYTTGKMSEKLQSEEIQDFFDVIRNLPKRKEEN